MKRLLLAVLVSAVVAAVLTVLVNTGVVTGSWPAFLGVAVSGGLGVWLSGHLARSTTVQHAFANARNYAPSEELVEELDAAGTRSKRTRLGRKTDEHTTRGPLGQVVSALLVLARHAYTQHPRTVITVAVLVAAYLGLQFVQVPIVTAMVGATTVLLFTTAAFTLVSLFTDGE